MVPITHIPMLVWNILWVDMILPSPTSYSYEYLLGNINILISYGKYIHIYIYTYTYTHIYIYIYTYIYILIRNNSNVSYINHNVSHIFSYLRTITTNIFPLLQVQLQVQLRRRAVAGHEGPAQGWAAEDLGAMEICCPIYNPAENKQPIISFVLDRFISTTPTKNEWLLPDRMGCDTLHLYMVIQMFPRRCWFW